jgi:heat shock protein HslJ
MDLAGTAWTLVGFETDAGVIPAATEAPATLDFAAGGEQTARLSGSGGCNRYFAGYSLAGDRLTLAPASVWDGPGSAKEARRWD